MVPAEVKALAATCPDALLRQTLRARRRRINSGRMMVGPQMESDSDTAVRRRILLRLLLQGASRSKNDDELNNFCEKRFYTGSGACRRQGHRNFALSFRLLGLQFWRGYRNASWRLW